jgi:hypothetical protein
MEAVIRDLCEIREYRFEDSSGMPPRHLYGSRSVARDADALGGRDDRPDHDAFIWLNVRSKNGEWIGVSRFRDRLQQRISFHSLLLDVPS